MVRCYVWNVALYGPETWALRKLDRRYLEIFESWCWQKVEKINKEILGHIGEKRTFLI